MAYKIGCFIDTTQQMIHTNGIKRRNILQILGIILCSSVASVLTLRQAFAKSHLEPLNKPPIAWRAQLSLEAYQVLFEQHTEEPNSSEHNHEHREGTFICAACYLPLFQSQYKYESGSGWPSFTQPITRHVGTQLDHQFGFARTEYHCIRCHGHQGHVFNDGPLPTKQRWCNNGLALNFVLKTDPLPLLRS